jgi:hypothetical protein
VDNAAKVTSTTAVKRGTTMTALHRFEGRDVIGTRIAVTNAGDGLSQALAIEPVELTIGQKVTIVLECEVGQVSFSPVKDTNALHRVQKLKAGTATIISSDLVQEALDAQRIKIEEANGLYRLDFADATSDESTDEATDGD